MKYICSTILVFFFSLSSICALIAQDYPTIRGRVIEKKTEIPLSGVSIQIGNTTKGSISDAEGYFSIRNVKPGSYNLTASFVGFQSETIFNYIVRTAGNEELVFRLEEDILLLNDVIVTPNPFAKSSSSPLSIQKLSKTEIETYPGGNNDIAKVVQSLPGIAGSIGGFRNDVII